jgi:hypothetical protein
VKTWFQNRRMKHKKNLRKLNGSGSGGGNNGANSDDNCDEKSNDDSIVEPGDIEDSNEQQPTRNENNMGSNDRGMSIFLLIWPLEGATWHGMQRHLYNHVFILTENFKITKTLQK